MGLVNLKAVILKKENDTRIMDVVMEIAIGKSYRSHLCNILALVRNIYFRHLRVSRYFPTTLTIWIFNQDRSSSHAFITNTSISNSCNLEFIFFSLIQGLYCVVCACHWVIIHFLPWTTLFLFPNLVAYKGNFV